MRTLLIIMTLLLAIFAAACGSAEDGSVDADAEVDADAGDTSVDVEATVDAEMAGISARCEEIAEAFTAIPQALASQPDAADIRAQADAFAEVSADVPDQYAADFQLYADYFSQIADAVESGDPAQLGELGAQSAELTEASTNLATFFANGCE